MSKKFPGDELPDPPKVLYGSWEDDDSRSGLFASSIPKLFAEEGVSVDRPLRIGVYKLIEVRTIICESTYRTRKVKASDFVDEDGQSPKEPT